MLEKIAKLEAAINKILTLIIGRLVTIMDKLIPNFLKTSYSNFLNKSKTLYSTTRLKIKQGISKLYQLVKDSINNVFDFLTKIQNYPIKQKFSDLILQIKLYLLSRSPREHLKYFSSYIQDWMKSKINKSKQKKNDRPYLIWTSLGVIVLVGSFSVYFSAKNIYKKEYPSRSIASVQEYDYRPEYRLYEQKTIYIRNVKLPVFVESIGEIDSITIDFSVRTSTRFARYFLEEYEYKLKDYFFTGMEPIISDFPIEQEGKSIVKEVIIQEINLFLKDNHVEGEVEEVNILYLIGS